MKPLKERFNLKFLRNYQKLLFQENNFKECFFKVNFYNIPIQERFIIDDSFIIISSSAEINARTTVPVLLNDGVFKAQFELEGYSFYEDENSFIEIKENTFNLFFLPRVNGKLHYKKNRRCVDIMFDKEWFETTLIKRIPEYQQVVEALKNNEPIKLFEKAIPIHANIKQVLNSMLNCKLPFNLKPAFYKIKIEELLLLMISYDEKFHSKEPEITNLSIDEMVMNVKDWVNKKEIGNIRLQEIEDIFKISQKSLNKGFQKYFGCSLAKYLRTVQMEKAYSLIKDHKYTVNEVSKLLRYSYPQHFTTAFTKHFGFSPKQLKGLNEIKKSDE